MVSSSLVFFLAASAAPSVLGFASYSQKLPNGDAFGKEIGHATKGYTPFGTLFSEKGKTWAGVCKEKWPGQATVTVGAVLGDPCCKWTSGKPDFELSFPNLAGTVCASSTGATPAPKTPAATPPAAAPASKAPAPVASPSSSPAGKPTTPAASPASKPAAPAPAPVAAPPAGAPAAALPTTTPVAAPVAAPVVANTTAAVATPPAGAKPSGKAHALCAN